CLGVGLGSAPAQAITIYTGFDVGANSTDPRPNSNASASDFDTAAGGLGSITLVNFEAAPVGPFASLTIAPGATISGATQSVRNSPSGTPDRQFGYNTTLGGSRFVELDRESLFFTFTQPVQAFGAYFAGMQVAGETITFSDGSFQSIPLPNPGDFGGVAF